MSEFSEDGIRINAGVYLMLESENDFKSFYLTAEEIHVMRRICTEWTSEKYCKNFFALDSEGRGVSATSEQAVRWCVEGYLCYILGMNESDVINDSVLFNYINDAARFFHNCDLEQLNDGGTHLLKWGGLNGHNNVRNLIRTLLAYHDDSHKKII